MPYDITDAFIEIRELQRTIQVLIKKLEDKEILDKPKEEKQNAESKS